jgi:hypothetical protein
MLAIAESLSRGFDHMRVDMYATDDEIWFGELTPYVWSGLTMFVPDGADKLIGSYWRLRRPIRRALSAIAFKWWEVPQSPA